MTNTLQQLLTSRRAAKLAEDTAVSARRQIDFDIALFMRDPEKDEGTVSREVGDMKASVVYAMNRKVDAESVKKDWGNLCEAVQKCFRFTADVSVTAMRTLTPVQLVEYSRYVTTKPGSASVKVEYQQTAVAA